MPACPSPIGRMPSSAGATATAKARWPMRAPATACWSTTTIRPHTGRWVGRCGCAAKQDGSLCRTGTGGGSQPQFRAWSLCAVLRPLASRAIRKQRSSSSDHSRHLSPFDPLLFGMLGARAMSHFRLGQFEEAADWALKAAARPNAHHHHHPGDRRACLALAGRLDEGTRLCRRHPQDLLPDYRADDFIGTFRFEPDAEAERADEIVGAISHNVLRMASHVPRQAGRLAPGDARRSPGDRVGVRPCRRLQRAVASWSSPSRK